MMNTNIAVIYARYSSDNQRHESIDAQVRACTKYAQDNGYTVSKIYIDEAKTGTNDDRDEFQQMIKDSKAKSFNFVIVHKLDRFSRNRHHSAINKYELLKNGVRVLSALERLDNSPESVILESLLEGMAEYYSANLSREVMKGMKENALKCKHTGGKPPLGYSLEPTTKTYVINEEEAEIVRLIFKMYIDGEGYGKIIDTLNTLDYKSKFGRSISKSSLSNLLENEKYMGIYTFNVSASRKHKFSDSMVREGSRKPESEIIRIEDGIPAIISKEDFEKAKARKALNKKNTATFKAKEFYLLSGLVTCGECGARMTGNTKNSGSRKTKHVTYRCGNRYSKHKCNNKEIRREYLEDFVLDQIMHKLFTPSNIRTFTTELQKMCKAENPELHQKIKNLNKQKKSLQSQQSNLVSAIKQGQALDVLLPELNNVKEQLTKIEGDILGLESTLNNSPQITEEIVTSLVSDMKNFIKSNNLPQVKRFIHSYVKELAVGMEEIHLVLQYPFTLSLTDKKKLDIIASVTKEDLFNTYSNKNL